MAYEANGRFDDMPKLVINSAGDEFDSKLSDILLHVALHGAYHRGQVNLLIRTAGGEPSPTEGSAEPTVAPTADEVPGAELLMIEGMGHDLPVEAWQQIISAITAMAARSA